VDELLTGRENLEMFGQLYHIPGAAARRRAAELLERFDLADAANRVVKTYSGGMRRRLDLAGSLIVSPPVLFLDEPTTGLDPRGRTEMWDVIANLVADGTTVLLTTQYLEEADLLANQIAVVDHGRVIARGTSDELKAQVGGERLEVTVARGSDLDAAARALSPYASSDLRVDSMHRRVIVPVTEGARLLAAVIRDLDVAGVQLDDLALRRPTLDDVFLTLTGHAAEETAADESASASRGSRNERVPA
jgi:ABC-2 type transport system ATP-binding protein